MFEGEYRSKPQVSLRGASKLEEEKDVLLRRATFERERRELERRKQLAVLKIQAVYRGSLERAKLHYYLRDEFDKGFSPACSPDVLVRLSGIFVMFFQPSKDCIRLASLCQKWLQYQDHLLVKVCSDVLYRLHLKKLLLACCRSLTFDTNQSLAIPLRMIEVYTSHTSYLPSTNVLGPLFSYLCSNGYYKTLRKVLELRVPAPDSTQSMSPGSTQSMSPLACSLLDYIKRPLVAHSDARAHAAVLSELFAPPLTPHVCHLLLPSLSTLPLESFVRSLSTDLSASPEVLYLLLSLVHHQLDILGEPALLHYLQLLPPLVSSLGQVSGDPDSWATADPMASAQELAQCCLHIITSSPGLGHRLGRCSVPYDPMLLPSLCALCHQLMVLTTQYPPHSPLLHRLALNTSLLSALWPYIATIRPTNGSIRTCSLQQVERGLPLSYGDSLALAEGLSTFVALFNMFLSTLHDTEFHGTVPGVCLPLSLGLLSTVIETLKKVFVNVHMDRHLPPTKPLPQHIELWKSVNKGILQLLCHLYERDSRQPFCTPKQWLTDIPISKIPPELFVESEEEWPVSSNTIVKHAELLKLAPFVFPFIERVKFFHQLVAMDRQRIQGNLQDFLIGGGIHVTVRRNHIYEDAFTALAQEEDMRQKLRVTFTNAQGLDEAGIDGGGLFREFLSQLLKTGFDPNHGFFTPSPDGLLYPNPKAPLLNEDFHSHYQFLGTMLGKSLYEHLMVELPFASFFLCKLCDRGTGVVGTHHLASLDSHLYKNLLSLKHYEGNFEDFSLNFTLTDDHFGHTEVAELKVGGAEIMVTRSNCIEYIHLIAHHKLNVQLHRQFQAFRSGLSKIIPLKWLQLFNQNELQVLISGAEVTINIDDLRNHTQYAGEQGANHPSIKMFWEVVDKFTDDQKKQLLRFVTSCSRPPLLGFKELHPPFSIMMGGPSDRLPTASTCMHLLKLPNFTDLQTLRSKLLYAISSGAGFELS